MKIDWSGRYRLRAYFADGKEKVSEQIYRLVGSAIDALKGELPAGATRVEVEDLDRCGAAKASGVIADHAGVKTLDEVELTVSSKDRRAYPMFVNDAAKGKPGAASAQAELDRRRAEALSALQEGE